MYREIDELNSKLREQARLSRKESEERQMQLDMREQEVERLRAVISELKAQAEIHREWLVAKRRNRSAESPVRSRTAIANSDAEAPTRSMTTAVKTYISFTLERYFGSQPSLVSPETTAAGSLELEKVSDCRPSGEVLDLQDSHLEDEGCAPRSSLQADVLLERCVRLEEQLELESERRTHWEKQCHRFENLEGQPKTLESDPEAILSRRNLLEEEILLLQQQRSAMAQQCELLKVAGKGGVAFASYNELQKIAMEVITKEKDDLSTRCTRLGDQLQQEEASRVDWEGKCKRLEALFENEEETLRLAEDARTRMETECERLKAVLRSGSSKLQTQKEITQSGAIGHTDDSKEECSRLKERSWVDDAPGQQSIRRTKASLHLESGGTGETEHAEDLLGKCTSLEDQLRQEKENSEYWQQKYHDLIKEAALNSGSQLQSILHSESSRPAGTATQVNETEDTVFAVARQAVTKVGEVTDAGAGACIEEKSNSCAAPEVLCAEAPGLSDCSFAGHSCFYKKELESARLLIAELSAQLAMRVQQNGDAMSNGYERQAAQTYQQGSFFQPPLPPQSQRLQRPRPQVSSKGSKESSRVSNELKVSNLDADPLAPSPLSARLERSPRHSITLCEPIERSYTLPPVNLQSSGQEAQATRNPSKSSTRSQMRIFVPTIDLEEGGVALMPTSTTSRAGSKASPKSAAEVMPSDTVSRSNSKVLPKSPAEPSPQSTPSRRVSEILAASTTSRANSKVSPKSAAEVMPSDAVSRSNSKVSPKSAAEVMASGTVSRSNSKAPAALAMLGRRVSEIVVASGSRAEKGEMTLAVVEPQPRRLL